jgi:DNA-binding NtrC family response regulator
MLRPAGDPEALAKTLKESLRKVDRVALYGDGTVELLLPERSAEEVKALLEHLSNDPLGTRCGVATFPGDGTSAEALLDAARSAIRRTSAQQPLQLGATPTVAVQAQDLVFVSPAMKGIYETLQRVADSAATVLLRGETGTGKEVLARLIHERSPRAKQPFIALNCGAIPGTLVESLLFGHERGAFTGAHASTEGVFAQADGGTLLLDEIGELPLAAQAALLRVLENKEVRRVGGKATQSVDVRVLAATHRDIDAMVKAGAFREDLLYRLNTLTIEVPALRARPEAIAPLIATFLAQANAQNARQVTGFDAEAMRVMLRYNWPGNIRELRNAVEHAVVVAAGPLVGPADLPRRVRDFVSDLLRSEEPDGSHAPPSDLRGGMARYETQMILEALRATGGNRTEAARRLQIPVRTLSHKIRRYGIKKLGFGVDAISAPDDGG